MFVEKFANDRIGIVEIESERYFFAIIKRYKEFKIKDQLKVSRLRFKGLIEVNPLLFTGWASSYTPHDNFHAIVFRQCLGRQLRQDCFYFFRCCVVLAQNEVRFTFD